MDLITQSLASIVWVLLALLTLAVLVIYVLKNRNTELSGLCTQLTGTINNMYCEEEGCTNLKYYSDPPADGEKGLLLDRCNICTYKHTVNND